MKPRGSRSFSGTFANGSSHTRFDARPISVEGTGEDDGTGAEEVDPVLSESMRIVREALERQRELTEELEGEEPSPEGRDDDED